MNARDALRLQLGHFLEEGLDVEHDARAYQAVQSRVNDPGRQEVQAVSCSIVSDPWDVSKARLSRMHTFIADLDRMSCVVSSLTSAQIL